MVRWSFWRRWRGFAVVAVFCSGVGMEEIKEVRKSLLLGRGIA